VDRPLPDGDFTCHRSVIGSVRLPFSDCFQTFDLWSAYMKMSPQEFQKALSQNSLVRPFVLQGLAKESDDGAALMFSIDGCGTWIPVPLELIEEVDFLNHVPCKDHSHPLVRLVLKRPAGDGAVFSGLLESLMNHLRKGTAEKRPIGETQNTQRTGRRIRHGRRGRSRAETESDFYYAGCKAMCYDSAYYVYGEGGGSDCNYAWDGCFSDLDYQCADQGGVVLSTRVGTYCEEG